MDFSFKSLDALKCNGFCCMSNLKCVVACFMWPFLLPLLLLLIVVLEVDGKRRLHLNTFITFIRNCICMSTWFCLMRLDFYNSFCVCLFRFLYFSVCILVFALVAEKVSQRQFEANNSFLKLRKYKTPAKVGWPH